MAVYLPAFKPWDHQRRATEWIRGRSVAALLMAMRTGKTKVLFDDFGQLELDNLCQDLMVVAPAGVYRTWETATEHLSEDLRRRLRIYLWESSSGIIRKRDLDDFMFDHGRPRLLLVNSEATSTVKRARDAITTFLDQRVNMGVYDESTDIKNEDSERGKFAIKEVKPRTNYRRILCGLPTPKSPLDAYAQFKYLDDGILGHGSFLGFKTQHTVMRILPRGRIQRDKNTGQPFTNPDGTPVRRGVPVTVSYRDVPHIRTKIEKHSFRVLLEDCYDMPKKMYFFRDVEWHPEQKRIYEELRHFATAQLGEMDYVTVTAVITQLIRMHQVLCGHVKNEAGELRDVPENRTEELLRTLEEYDGKVVIWCSYDYNIRKLADAISKRFAEFGRPAKVARFWGGNRNTREAEEKMFQEDPECRWNVATAAAGGKGRMWAIADLALYFSNTANLDHRMQSEERIQAMDKETSCGYGDLRVLNSIDMRWIDTLRDKKNLSDVITGDTWKEWLI